MEIPKHFQKRHIPWNKGKLVGQKLTFSGPRDPYATIDLMLVWVVDGNMLASMNYRGMKRKWH
jgi:hypothetical protein